MFKMDLTAARKGRTGASLLFKVMRKKENSAKGMQSRKGL